MNWRHPSDHRLDRWASGKAGYRSARHAQHCGLCQARLEALTELEPGVRADLESGLVPSTGFEDRLRQRLERKVTNREALAVLSDLLDVGPRTSRLLLENDERDESDDE